MRANVKDLLQRSDLQSTKRNSRKRKQSDSAEETQRKLNSKLTSKLTIADRNAACRLTSRGKLVKLEKVFLLMLSIEKGELITIHSSSPRQNISLIFLASRILIIQWEEECFAFLGTFDRCHNTAQHHTAQ